MAYVDNMDDLDTVHMGARVEDYFALLKPRLMSLVVFTALVGMLLAPVGVHPVVAVISIFCIAVGAGASGALNMWYDADIDAIMSRTKNRPIPSGRLDKGSALGFGLVLSVFSVTILGLAANWLAAGLLALTILYYLVIYTMWLKRTTAQNTVIGGVAGALPPVIGWVSVTGSASLEPLLLFLIIFLWSPPHFWALSLYKKSDYEAAGIPMLPNVVGEHRTKIHLAVYSVLLAWAGFAPAWFGFAGPLYGTLAGILGLTMIALSIRLFGVEGAEMRRRARTLFLFSLSYLFATFAALLVEALALNFFGTGVAR